MHRRLRLSLLFAAFVALCAAVAGAQYTRDAAAKKKIQEAINTHYLATDFAKAESILLGTIQACEDKCSTATLCEAWMYVGIVRGSGKNDQKGAQEAFVQAVTFEPGCKLDMALATPETQGTFQRSGGTGAGAAPTPKGKGTPPAVAAETAGDMQCTPEVREVETRRPIPVSCEVPDGATRAELKYKEFGGEQWQTVKMQKKGDEFRATIPCTATQTAGTLRVYITAKDPGGETADTWGSKSKPVEIQLVQQSDQEAPSFPDDDAPDRCPETEICPPGMPGCGAAGAGRGNKKWGDTCQETMECESGLVCLSGQCEQAPSCDVDADCAQGKCVGGYCDPTAEGPAGPYKKNWLGLHVAQDVAFVSGTDVCTGLNQDNGFACFESDGTNFGDIRGDETAGEASPGFANKIAGGFTLATTRILLSYDRAITGNIMVGARAGYAIGGGPTPVDGSAFLPIHGEVRGSYWFGAGALSKVGFRPYVHVGGGLAQVDAKLEVTVIDCSTQQLPDGTLVPSDDRSTLAPGEPGPNQDACMGFDAAGNPTTPDPRLGAQTKLDAYKKLGQGFATAGGGVVYAFKNNMGVQLNLNMMLMLGTSGFVIEPSLGFVYGL